MPASNDPSASLQSLLEVGGPAVAIIVALGGMSYLIGKYVMLPIVKEWAAGSASIKEGAAEAAHAATEAREAATASHAAAQNSLSAAQASNQIVETLIERMKES